jgi:hypothetical protein
MAGRNVEAACAAAGAAVETISAFPDFHRLQATRGGETCIVDLVVDRAPALDRDKVAFGIVRVDTRREITANKLCTVFSRAEPRDLVDLMFLLRDVPDIRPALRDAETKDGGFNPADLAKLLADISIPAGAALPGRASAIDLDSFRRRMIEELQTVAFERTKDISR